VVLCGVYRACLRHRPQRRLPAVLELFKAFQQSDPLAARERPLLQETVVVSSAGAALHQRLIDV
jgi:hypothetical protein